MPTYTFPIIPFSAHYLIPDIKVNVGSISNCKIVGSCEDVYPMGESPLTANILLECRLERRKVNSKAVQ